MPLIPLQFYMYKSIINSFYKVKVNICITFFYKYNKAIDVILLWTLSSIKIKSSAQNWKIQRKVYFSLPCKIPENNVFMFIISIHESINEVREKNKCFIGTYLGEKI